MENEKYVLRKARSEDMLKNGVEPIKDGFNEYWIPSQNDKSKKYKVTIKDKWYSCSCPDNKEGNLCKHILLLKTYLAIKLKARENQKNISVSNPCPNCNSTNLLKDGTRKTIIGKKQRWLCKDCKKRFVNNPIKKIKGNIDTVITAIDLYMKGVSYRGIVDTLKQFYGLKVTHVTVMNWVNNYMKKINDYVNTLKPNVSDTWQADEQFIKAKGKKEYIWNVLDQDTRFLLASNESPTRRTSDAIETFQKAKEVAGKKAKNIITDGAFSYNKAIRKEFWTYKNRYPHKKYISLKQKTGNNNRIERFHGTFRQRDKIMRGFGGNQKQHADNFRTYYNFIKEHSGYDMKQTPAQKAGIDIKSNWKELLLKSL